jgi:hypothetical protein
MNPTPCPTGCASSGKTRKSRHQHNYLLSDSAILGIQVRPKHTTAVILISFETSVPLGKWGGGCKVARFLIADTPDGAATLERILQGHECHVVTTVRAAAGAREC